MDTESHDPHDPTQGRRVSLLALAREAALVALLAATLNLVGNGRISLWDRDEPRYATCAREMQASGDYVLPTFNAEPRYHKPVLIYWLMLGGMSLFGDNPFGARLVSALAGASTCVLVWAWGRRMLGPRWPAGRLDPGDGPDHGGGVETGHHRRHIDAVRGWLPVRPVGAGTAPVGSRGGRLLDLARTGDPDQVTRRPCPDLRLGRGILVVRRSNGVLGSAALALGTRAVRSIVIPWNLAILIRSQGAYYNVAVGYHIVRRMTYGIEEHGGFPGYYIVTSLLTFFPWSALLPAALAGAWLRRRVSPTYGFLLGWAIGPLVFLECRAHQADSLLPAGVPGLRSAGGLAERGAQREWSGTAPLAARASIVRHTGDDRLRRGSRSPRRGLVGASGPQLAVPDGWSGACRGNGSCCLAIATRPDRGKRARPHRGDGIVRAACGLLVSTRR